METPETFYALPRAAQIAVQRAKSRALFRAAGVPVPRGLQEPHDAPAVSDRLRQADAFRQQLRGPLFRPVAPPDPWASAVHAIIEKGRA